MRKRLKQRRRERRKMTQKTQRGQVYVSGLSESLTHDHARTHIRTHVFVSANHEMSNPKPAEKDPEIIGCLIEESL